MTSRRRHARDGARARRGERLGKFPRRLVAVGWDFLERALDHDFEIVRNRIAHDFQSRHRIERMTRHDRLRRGSGERRLAGQRLVEHTRETVDVTAPIDLPRSRCLLGRHVRRSADGQAGLRELVAAGRADGTRDAEVRDDRVPARQHDVLRLDVTVHHVVLVRVRERLGNLVGDLQRIVHRQLRLAIQPVAEGFAFDEWHDVIERPTGVTRVVDRQDVGMLQARREFDLAQKPFAPQRDGDFGP